MSRRPIHCAGRCSGRPSPAGRLVTSLRVRAYFVRPLPGDWSDGLGTGAPVCTGHGSSPAGAALAQAERRAEASEVIVREYEADDAASTREVFHAAVRRTALAHYTPEQVKAWAPDEIDLDRWRRRRGAAWTVVAVCVDELVGFADRTDADEMDMLFVHPDHGRRGTASALMARVVSEAGRRGLPRVDVRASRVLQPLLEGVGFVVARVHLATRRSAYAHLLPAPVLAGMTETGLVRWWERRMAAAPSPHRLLLAVALGPDTKVLGFAHLDPGDAGLGELYAIHVHPHAQGMRLGARLLHLAVAALCGLKYRRAQRGCWRATGTTRASTAATDGTRSRGCAVRRISTA